MIGGGWAARFVLNGVDVALYDPDPQAARKVGESAGWIRSKVAQVVWLVALACAVVLGVGALLTALKANPDNAIVSWVLARAGQLDGPFIDIFTFSGDNAAMKQTLVGWALAAVAFLVVGRVAERVIKP